MVRSFVGGLELIVSLLKSDETEVCYCCLHTFFFIIYTILNKTLRWWPNGWVIASRLRDCGFKSQPG